MPHTGKARTVRVFLACAIALAIGCGQDPLEEARALQDEENDLVASLEPLRALVEERPEDPEVHYRYGRALIAAGDFGLAQWPLRKAMESPDWLERAGLALASTRIMLGAHDEAAEICTRILEEHPDDVQALLVRATAYTQGRRAYDAALADAERVLELDPDNRDALEQRVLALLGLQRVEEAGDALQEYESLYVDASLDLHGSPSLCMARATFAKEKGEAELAEQRHEKCLERFPTDGLVLSGVIGYFDGLGRPERSHEILREAVRIAPGSLSYRTALALRLADEDRVEEGEAVLREGAELAPPAEAAAAWATLASFRVDHGDLDAALEAFARARDLDVARGASSPDFLLAYADALVIAGRYDEAERVIEEIAVPAHRLALRARMALERGDPAGALELFEEAESLWPNNAISRYYTARAAEQLGDFERASDEYRYALRIDVQATDAYLRLAQLQAAAGHPEAALSTLRFKPGGRPEEVAAGLLEVRLLARQGQEARMPPRVRAMLARPPHWASAVAALGEGVRERSGPEAALERMRAAEPLDLTDPTSAPALAAIVEDLGAIGRSAEGAALADAALREHPEAAALHALLGRALRLAGEASARDAFERALALDPEERLALVGLARLEAEAGAHESALALYDRALAAHPHDPIAARESAALLASRGRTREAEERLTALLREHPWNADAARELAELRLARGVVDERTRELAGRAVRFGGRAPAAELLERIASSPASEEPGAVAD